MSEIVEPRSTGEFMWADRLVVGARSDWTFIESMGIAANTVKKKDGQTRWVKDLRELNKQRVKDSYPLTNIQEILHSLQGPTVFSSLDACGAYHAVCIEHGSPACTAFISPFGTFQYICMPFGLANTGRCWTLPWRRWTGISGRHTWMISWLSAENLGHI